MNLFKQQKAAPHAWIHSAESLTNSKVVYPVKFLGSCNVRKPKGTDVVKEAIAKMQLHKSVKKAEGVKMPKVDLCISVETVSIQDSRTKVSLHEFPLHMISFVADDKNDKRKLAFVVKETSAVTNGNGVKQPGDTDKPPDAHSCYVFDSNKCAADITLTLGQAFDLAYRRFLHRKEAELSPRRGSALQAAATNPPPSFTQPPPADNDNPVNGADSLLVQLSKLTEENKLLKERVAYLENVLGQQQGGQLQTFGEPPSGLMAVGTTPEATATGSSTSASNDLFGLFDAGWDVAPPAAGPAANSSWPVGGPPAANGFDEPRPLAKTGSAALLADAPSPSADARPRPPSSASAGNILLSAPPPNPRASRNQARQFSTHSVSADPTEVASFTQRPSLTAISASDRDELQRLFSSSSATGSKNPFLSDLSATSASAQSPAGWKLFDGGVSDANDLFAHFDPLHESARVAPTLRS